MDSKRKVSPVFKNNLQGSRLRGRPKNRWWNCVQTYIDTCKINNWIERSKTELTGRCPLRKRRSEEEEEETSKLLPSFIVVKLNVATNNIK